jgi:hypothetical protein
MRDTLSKTVTFIQYEIPPLKAGKYKLTAHQTLDKQPAPNDFSAERTFAVGGNRFQLDGDDLVACFPPDNANGEFEGVLPNVVLKRSTLPWQRALAPTAPRNAPWLAVLLFESAKAPTVQTGTAVDLIADGTTITVTGSDAQGTGKMPRGTVSCPDINPLDYGQLPSTPTRFIDVPVDLFSGLAPTAADMPYLAHIREIDTYDSVDDKDVSKSFSVLLGNRIPQSDTDATAYLVSLENMGDYLPTDDGQPSAKLPAGTTTIRLIVLTSWHFYANDLDESFQNLAENLNKDSAGTLGATTLRIDAPAPASWAVAAAIADEATTVSGADADALTLNALAQGYVPMNHHLREAGDTVSWYRGPLLPYGGTSPFVSIPAFGPDALLRYDPYIGMLDASYAAAWQLGQLLGLQSSAFSTALYAWRKTLAKADAARAEQALLLAQLTPEGGDEPVFASFSAKRQTLLTTTPDVPDLVAAFIGQLRVLIGVPFAWLVPHEAMLPTESFRLFSVDPNWIDALVDGAFSIGRATESELQQDAAQQGTVHLASSRSARGRRVNDRPQLAGLKASATDALQTITGVLLRSQLVSGWPRLNINGYADQQGTQEVPKLRMERLSSDAILCLFDGMVASVSVHEAPEQLHCGLELAGGAASTTLRMVSGSDPGQQIHVSEHELATASVPLRADNQTLKVADAATSVLNTLTTQYGQNIPTFSSAEFALEFVKGVVKVEFVVGC